jgi:signal transduction histidine kinase
MSNLRFAAVYDQNSSLERIAVRKDWPVLRSILDKALASITSAERIALERKWLPGPGVLRDPSRLRLTRAEREWIKAHPVIRIGVDPEFRPFEFIDGEGHHRGYSADYVRLLNERLGLNMQLVPNLTWKQVLDRARRHDIDVLPCVGMTRERQTFLEFSEPYLEFHRVIITRADAPFMRGLEDIADKVVAVQASSSHVGFLREKTAIRPHEYPTLRQALVAVSDGDADAFVGNIASATYWIRRMNLGNLKVAAAASHEVQTLHFAVRKDWPVLVRILEKGLAAISEREKRQISQRWMAVTHDPRVDYGLIIRIVVVAVAMLVVFLLWNLQTRRSRKRLAVAKDEAVAASERARAANDELRKMQEELEALVRSRTAQLIQSEKMFHSAQKMEALGTLVSGIAHDFNNILTGILGSVFLAQVHGDRPEIVEERLQAAAKLGYRGAELIKQLLSFAHKSSEVEKSRIEMAAFLEEISGILRTTIPTRVSFVASAEEELAIEGSPPLIEQALINLVNNACDAVDDVDDPQVAVRIRRVRISEEQRDAHPELGAEELVRIDVTDNGHGIDEETLEKLFDPFFTTKGPGKGTGLGLSMVFGTVRDHGGFVEVDSEVGSGSTFSIYLPLYSGDDAVEATDEVLYRGDGETVLLVDDDDDVLETHAAMLSELGYEVLTAHDGAEAIASVAEDDSIALVILDAVMPEMDGLTAAREIRQRRPHLPLFFLSAHDLDRDLPTHLLRSNEVLLMKPCSPATLSRTVKQRIEGARGARNLR